MDLDDRLVIATPEGIELELQLAGLGSRTAAGLVDLVLQLLLIAACAVALRSAGDAGAAAFSIAVFVVFFGYYPLFEVLAAGRSPGKRLSGLRVVRSGGEPVGLAASSIRNLVRLIDLIPGFYLVGGVAILVSERNQRLGDLAADTVVVRERADRRAPAWSSLAPAPGPDLPAWMQGWDVSAVTAHDLALVRSFLARRDGLAPDARSRLADELTQALRPKVGGLPIGIAGEPFLEALAAVKAARG